MNATAKTFAPSQPNLVPPAARKQIAEANKLIADLNKPPAADPNAPTPPAPAAATPPAAPAQPPAKEMQAAPPAAPAPLTPEVWENRYRSLRGKYDAEGASQRALISQQQELINNLVSERQAREAAPAAPSAPSQSAEQRLIAAGVTPKQIEEYGVELLEMMTRLGRAVNAEEIDRLERELAALKATTGNVAAHIKQNSQQAVYEALNKDVPGWQTINNSDEFEQWLNLVDVFAGTTRLVALQDAYQRCDATRVVAIFQAFQREDTARRAAANQPQVDPATLLAPSQPRGAAPEAPGGSSKRIWSESEIRDFYTRVRKKKVSPEEYASVTADIATAAAEGRIRPDSPDHHSNQR